MDILWILLLILFAVLRNAGKKKTRFPGSNGQPWDTARRRQPLPRPIELERERPVETGRFPLPQEMRDFLDEIWEVPEKTVEEPAAPGWEAGETPKVKQVLQQAEIPEKADPGEKAPIMPRLAKTEPEGSVNLSTVAQGFIWSEILQPPRAKRPVRYR